VVEHVGNFDLKMHFLDFEFTNLAEYGSHFLPAAFSSLGTIIDILDIELFTFGMCPSSKD